MSSSFVNKSFFILFRFACPTIGLSAQFINLPANAKSPSESPATRMRLSHDLYPPVWSFFAHTGSFCDCSRCSCLVRPNVCVHEDDDVCSQFLQSVFDSNGKRRFMGTIIYGASVVPIRYSLLRTFEKRLKVTLLQYHCNKI